MTNDLQKMAKNLKAFAKRCKDFKYTEHALYAFLIMGMLSFSNITFSEVKNSDIASQEKQITQSFNDIGQQLKKARNENNKLLKNYNLELVQLMEQGNHVVKSPWSSWQYGVNAYIGDWKGTYKGKGNKIKDIKYLRDTSMNKTQYHKLGDEFEYGNTTYLGLKREPAAMIPVSASLTPMTPKIKQANLSLNVDLSSLPNFQPRVIEAPKAPNVNAPEVNIRIGLQLNAMSKGSWQKATAMNNNNPGQLSGYNGVFEGVALLNGVIDARRTNSVAKLGFGNWNYDVPSLEVMNTSHNALLSTTNLAGLTQYNSRTLTTTVNGYNEKNLNGLFQVSGNDGNPTGAFLLNNAKVNYTSLETAPNNLSQELVHQDVHHGLSTSAIETNFTKVNIEATGFKNDFKDITKTNVLEDVATSAALTTGSRTTNTLVNQYNVFANNGNIVMSGPNASFSNSYMHGITSNGVIMNRGNITLNKGNGDTKQHAIFVVSPDVYGEFPQQYFYNSGNGKITTNTDETAMFYFKNNGGDYSSLSHNGRRRIAVINRAAMEMNGDISTGVFLDVNNGTTVFNNFSDVDSINSQGQLQSFLSDSTVPFVSAHATNLVNKLDMTKLDTGTKVEANAKPIVINGNRSAGIYIPHNNAFINGMFAVDLRGSGIDASGKAGSAGIYSFAPIDLQAHYIHLNGTINDSANNIGVYTPNTSLVNLGYGRVKITNGKRNTGIAVMNGGAVHSESEMQLNGGERNTAIYASGHNSLFGGVKDVAIKSIETLTPTKDNVFIFADNSAQIKTHEGKGGLKIKSGISNNPVAYNPLDAEHTGHTTGAVYANRGANVDISRSLSNTFIGTTSTDWNAEITGAYVKAPNSTGVLVPTKVSTGFGLYADNNSTINADNNRIKVVGGSTAIAADNNSTVSLKGSTVHYEGEGYALYTNNGGTIDMSKLGTVASNLILGGKAVGYVNKIGAPSVNLNGGNIHIISNDVIVADLQSSSGPIVLNSNDISPTTGTGNSLKEQVLGGNVSITHDPGITKYKYASIDGGILNINKSLDEASTVTDSDSEVFTKRLLYQNSKINVANTGGVKANLNSTQLSDLNLSSPVGIAISGSGKSTTNNDTQINNDGKIEANRIGTGLGAVGLYINYGKIHNQTNGNVEIELTSGNNNAVGLFGTNGFEVTNDGNIKVKGKKSFGILGLAYRLDTTGNIIDPSKESFAISGTGNTSEYGKVDINNNKNLTMYDDSAIGIYALNNTASTSIVRGNSDIKAINNSNGIITINGNNNSIAIAGSEATLINDGKININGTKSAGMYGNKTSILTNSFNGKINVASTSTGNESIGMFTDDKNTIINTSGEINVGNSSYGIYGKKVNMNGGKIEVSDDAVGIYATGPAVNLNAGKITVANKNAVGVYIADDNKNPQATSVISNIDMKVGDNDSFGYLITSSKAKTDLTINPTTNPAHIGEKSVYVYSNADPSLGGNIANASNVIMDKNNAYGIYSSQNFSNSGSIDLTSGVGNIGLYSTQGVGTNTGYIMVGPSNISTKQYGIGMATGYYNETSKVTTNQGTIINENGGIIDVTTDNSIGMYVVGTGSKAINKGTINLSGNNTTGMYIDRYAIGENYGTIQTIPTANGKGIKGVVVTNGGIIKNYGTINIQGQKNIGVYAYRGDETNPAYVPYKQISGSNSSTQPYLEGSATDKKTVGSVTIQVPPASLPSDVSVEVAGVKILPSNVDTDIPSPQAPNINITDTSGITNLNLASSFMNNHHSNAEISNIGMYIDTSGINYTNPIQGLNNLTGLEDINLVFGTEVSKYLNGKAIQIGNNILKPYNDALGSVLTTGTNLNVTSSSLTWLAQPVQSGNLASPIKTVYLVKIPYTDFANTSKDKDTYNFLDGLEQRYGVEGINSREKQIFNKLNDLGKGEEHIFAQAVNEMKGYEYSNTQMRINATGNMLDNEFKYLHDQWRNPSKQNNKIKIFTQRDQFKTNTAGVIDYNQNAYGVAYVHEDEAVTLGNSTGWYAGAITSTFDFKDLGKSREQQSMVKAGLFKTMSPHEDHNGSLKWTIASDIFGGLNKMHRKYWVVDDVFDSKADYYSYGVALKNDLSYDMRLSERTHLKPYMNLKMEYGRFSNIKEDRGQMNLQIKGNDYFSIKPEIGAEFKYVQPFAKRSQLSLGLTAAYENELGKLNNLNQAKVRYTTADYYNLKNEKENRSGNGKFDLNLGIDNTRFGVTVNAGYDTKGNNIRGGIGFRAIY